jgi:hypothetical protein
MAFRTTTLLAALALAGGPLEGQQVNLGRFWAGAGLGGASTGVNCDLCVGDRSEGFSGFLAAGVALSPKLRLGAEANGWFDGTDDVNQRLMLYGASLLWSPNPSRPWYFKGGLGLVRYHAGTDDPDDDGLSAGTLGLQLGGGYDLRFSERWSITPFANVIASTTGDLTSGSTIVTDVNFTVLQLGAGITYR